MNLAIPAPQAVASERRFLLRDFAQFPLAPLLQRANPALYAQTIEVQQRTREYADRVLRPNVAAWDGAAGRDHGFVPWEAIDAGLPCGFFSLAVPGLFGGGNAGPVPMALFSEEIAAADAGYFVVYGAHGLAWALVLTSLDLRMARRLGSEIVDGERAGRPVILALAHTEASGGSDVEDVDDIRRAGALSRWEKVPGGFRLRARKVFCSNAAIARYIVLTAYGDPADPLGSMRAFVIPAGAPGLAVGRAEHKMGQRLCVANEVVCDDLFVPDADAFSPGDAAIALDSTLTLTRGPVGAMSAGIIRGTLERTLDWLAHRRMTGDPLAEAQWVQMALADMLAALQTARALYMDAALASDAWGFSQFLQQMPAHLPESLRRNRLLQSALQRDWLREIVRDRVAVRVPQAKLQRVVAHASIAKFVASDMAVATAMKAMEILGADADDPRWGVEKCLRDAKLAQIFEGTNQINRLHAVRGLLG